jgi:hypothetical protein
VPFHVIPNTAEAASNGTTPRTGVGAVRNVLAIVAIVGGSGGVGGGMLRYGAVQALARRFRGWLGIS